MKNQKSFLLIFAILLAYSLNVIKAQEKIEYDKAPIPVGGIEAIMKNVIYPEEAKKENIEGKVFVKAIIDENGNVLKVEILKSENELLNNASLKAVKSSKFVPAELNGKKIKVEITIPIKFKLS